MDIYIICITISDYKQNVYVYVYIYICVYIYIYIIRVIKDKNTVAIIYIKYFTYVFTYIFSFPFSLIFLSLLL